MSLLHHLSSASALLAFTLLPVGSFAQLSFESHVLAQGTPASGVYAHGDFNNDGREDLVASGNSGYSLYLSNGDGTYGAPASMPARVAAIGDFNEDGKLDFAAISNTGALVVYLGNGNGTFRAPETITNPGTTNSFFVVAADMNHDNKTDLVTVSDVSNGQTYPTTIQIWLSNGDGTFRKGQTTVTANPVNTGVEINNLVTGDFDGDGKPDIALLYSFIGPVTVQVFYGDGAGNVGSPYFTTDPNGYNAGQATAADLNNDGKSDLIYPTSLPSGRYGSSQSLPVLGIYTGNANRTLTYGAADTSQCPSAVSVADFDGDGRNDLAVSETACDLSSPDSNIIIKLGSGGISFGGEQIVYQNLYGTSQPYSIRSSLGTRPDLVFNQSSASFTPAANVLLANASDGGFPACGFAGGAEGITICAPGSSSTSPVKFSIGTAGPTPMRTAAVWVDGRKVNEQLTHAFSSYSFLDASLPLSTGTHAVTIYGTGWDNTLQERGFTVKVGASSPCPPVTGEVNLCSPQNGATLTSPVTIVATSGIQKPLARMEVWIDGVKKYTETTGPDLTFTISLPAGSHRFAVFADDTTGGKTESFDYATVQ